jgi:Na+-driven multidrug efflux pump
MLLCPIPKRCLDLFPVLRLDKLAQVELVLRGAAVGLHAAVGSFVVGFVFLLALSRNGEAPVRAAAIAFSWYSFLSALPFGVAQAAGIVTAEASGKKNSSLLEKAVTTGDRICFHLAFTIAIGLFIAGSLFWWLIDPVTGSSLGMALFGISLHAFIDGNVQARVWSLRALGRQSGILIANLVAGLLYAGSLFFITGTGASWFLLFGYDLVLYLLLGWIRAQSIPVQPSRGGMNKRGTGASRLVSADSGRAAFDSTSDQ